jgi:hypothetical protein
MSHLQLVELKGKAAVLNNSASKLLYTQDSNMQSSKDSGMQVSVI